jgi:hypothetical protein
MQFLRSWEENTKRLELKIKFLEKELDYGID